MNMNYISVSSSDSKISLTVKGEFWIFFFLATVFLAITLGGYYCWLHFQKLSWSKSRFFQVQGASIP